MALEARSVSWRSNKAGESDRVRVTVAPQRVTRTNGRTCLPLTPLSSLVLTQLLFCLFIAPPLISSITSVSRRCEAECLVACGMRSDPTLTSSRA